MDGIYPHSHPVELLTVAKALAQVFPVGSHTVEGFKPNLVIG
jgi:hypothetical protein